MRILPLSVVIITHNEEANIEKSIRSVLPVCDDIVVVDSGSTDQTVRIAESLGARVFQHPWQGYSKQKNYGNAQAKYPYIFSLDADESFSPALREDLVRVFEQKQLKPLYRVNRFNHFCGKPIRHGAWYPDWHYRLFDKRTIYWLESDEVHEELNFSKDTPREDLKGDLIHYTTNSESYYLEKMDKYARLMATKMANRGKKAGPLKAYASACFRFFSEFVLQLGFLDGKEGFMIAKAHFIYTFRKYEYLRNTRIQ